MKIEVKGMSCGNCKARIEKALLENYGINAVADLKEGSVEFELGNNTIDQVKETISDLGFDC